MLNNEDEYKRYKAAVLLGRNGDGRAIEPLIKALKDKYRCSEAAEALGHITDGRVVEPLIALLEMKASIPDATLRPKLWARLAISALSNLSSRLEVLEII